MSNILKQFTRLNMLLFIIIILTMCVGLNKVYSVERDPNSSKGFATYDDQTAAEEARETIENDIEHQQVDANNLNKSNNNYLASLQIEGYELVPGFSKEIMEYYLNKDIESDIIKISAAPDDSRASVVGTGEIKLNSGDENCRIEVTSESGTVRTYIIHLKTMKEAQGAVDVNGKDFIENNQNSNIILVITLIIVIFLVFIIVFILKKKRKHKNEGNNK